MQMPVLAALLSPGLWLPGILPLQRQRGQGLAPAVPRVLLVFAIAAGLDHPQLVTGRCALCAGYAVSVFRPHQ